MQHSAIRQFLLLFVDFIPTVFFYFVIFHQHWFIRSFDTWDMQVSGIRFLHPNLWSNITDFYIRNRTQLSIPNFNNKRIQSDILPLDKCFRVDYSMCTRVAQNTCEPFCAWNCRRTNKPTLIFFMIVRLQLQSLNIGAVSKLSLCIWPYHFPIQNFSFPKLRLLIRA